MINTTEHRGYKNEAMRHRGGAVKDLRGCGRQAMHLLCKQYHEGALPFISTNFVWLRPGAASVKNPGHHFNVSVKAAIVFYRRNPE